MLRWFTGFPICWLFVCHLTCLSGSTHSVFCLFRNAFMLQNFCVIPRKQVGLEFKMSSQSSQQLCYCPLKNTTTAGWSNFSVNTFLTSHAPGKIMWIKGVCSRFFSIMVSLHLKFAHEPLSFIYLGRKLLFNTVCVIFETSAPQTILFYFKTKNCPLYWYQSKNRQQSGSMKWFKM